MASAARPGTLTTDVAKWDAYHSATAPPPWESGVHCSQLAALVAKLEGRGLAAEMGCGGGQSTRFLASSGFRAIGIDISASAVARAVAMTVAESLPLAADLKSFASASPGTVAFHQSDILGEDEPARLLQQIAPDSKGVDLLFDCQTFHCLRCIDEPRAAAAYAQLVRPGGKLVMLCGAVGEPERTEPGPPALTTEEATAAMLSAGFTLDSCERVRFDSTPTYGDVPPLAWFIVCTRKEEA